MQKSIIIGETTIYLGNKLRANKNAEVRGICSCDEIVEVKAIKTEDRSYIGLYSENKHRSWGSLDGAVNSYHGVWQDAEGLFNFFDLIYRDKIVTTDYYFKKRSLKGMKCKVLYQNHRQGQCFVEFNENIGGGSADGLGKSGHCVVLPSVLLENMEESEEKKAKAKKKAPGKVVETNESLSYDKDLWNAIADSDTIEQEPIAIKAMIAAKQSNIDKLSKDAEPKAGRWLDQPVLSDATNIDWEKAAKDLWRMDEIGHPAEGYATKNQWKKEHLIIAPKKSKTFESIDTMGVEEPTTVHSGYIDFGEEPDFYDES